MSASRQLIVGLFLAGGIVLFAVGLFWIGNRRLLFEDHIVLNAEFYNLSGLKNGAKVRVSGVDAGEVLQIAVPPDPESRFRVTFRVLEKFIPILRSDSVASIQTEGLVGSMILQVDAGSNQGSPVASGDTIRSREPVELSDMVQKASETVDTLSEAILDVKKRVDDTLIQVNDLATETTEAIAGVSENLERFVATGARVADDVEAIVARIRKGEGTIGKLMNDPQLYENLKGTLGEIEQAAGNIRESTGQARELMAELKSRGAIEDVTGTIANVREITEQAKQAFADLRPEGEEGEGGLMADLQATIANAREATADLSENMEALKRNFLMSGFFKDRGFYDLADLSVEEYRSGEFAPKRDRRRTWIHENELFTTGKGGEQLLSEEGKEKLDQAIAEYLAYAPSTPLIVEGYSATGDESEQFLRSRERASLVRRYLLEKYDLKPNYVGVMPMGAVQSDAGDGRYWEGVAVIYFPEKEKTKASTDVRMPPAQNGFRPVIGGLPNDSGFALGGAYQETDLFQGAVDAAIVSRASFKRYLHTELHVDLPRLAKGNLFLEATTRFRNYPEENFFGLGPDSSEDAQANYRLEDVDSTVDFGFRPWRNMRVGASVGYLAVNVGPGKDDDFPSLEEAFAAGAVPGLERQSDYLHTGLFAEYEFGEIPPLPFFPSFGVSGDYSFRWTYFDDRNSGGFSFRRYDIDLRHFVPVRQNRDIIATRGLVSLTDTPPGQRVPFFLLPTVGGGDTLRGFHQYRFRDSNVLLLQAEYRRWIRPFLDLVAFAEAGKAFSRIGQLALNKLEGSAGAGARLKVGGGVLIGVDVGFSREGVHAWVRGSHTF